MVQPSICSRCMAFEQNVASSESVGTALVSGKVAVCSDAAYLNAVSDIQDLEYFENATCLFTVDGHFVNTLACFMLPQLVRRCVRTLGVTQ